MGSIADMYERVAGAAALPAVGEMRFYAGSPDADVLVVGEAPRGAEGSAYARAVARYRSGEWDADDATTFWRAYPFTDEFGDHGLPDLTRERLHRRYVDDLLAFVDDPVEEVGFVDVAKRPLGDRDLGAALSAADHDYGTALAAQLLYVDPDVVVCNRASVSSTVPELLGLTDPADRSPTPTRVAVAGGAGEFTLVFSATAHVSMDTYSRRRLSKEVEWVYERGGS